MIIETDDITLSYTSCSNYIEIFILWKASQNYYWTRPCVHRRIRKLQLLDFKLNNSISCICSISHRIKRSCIHSILHSLILASACIFSILHAFTRSCIHAFLQSPNPALTHSCIYSFLHSLILAIAQSCLHPFYIHSIVHLQFLHSLNIAFPQSRIHSILH